jgi:hypothetical protein
MIGEHYCSFPHVMSQKYAWPLWIYRVISAVNVDGIYDVTYDNDSWDKNVAPELLKAVMRRKSTRRKQNPTWTMAPVVNTPWSDASILNDKNLVQGRRKCPHSSVYRA